MRIAFFGTPDFAVPCLEALLKSGGDQVVAVVTQPDKPKGRGQEMQPPPVKEVALRAGIPVLQPGSVRKPPFAPELATFAPDLAVVVAYGKILPKELLEVPKRGCINVHGSILPRWRGAAPIQWAVLAGDEVSGVTTMQMDVGMDTGDLLLTRELELAANETAGSLFDRLAPVGAELLLETIAGMKSGSLTPRKQDDRKATHARMLTKEDGRIIWKEAAIAVDRRVRGTSPWPGAFTTAGGKLLKVHRVRWTPAVDERPPPTPSLREGGNGLEQITPGRILVRDAEGIHVQSGDGTVILLEVQPEGGKRMTGAEFARGRGASLERLGDGE